MVHVATYQGNPFWGYPISDPQPHEWFSRVVATAVARASDWLRGGFSQLPRCLNREVSGNHRIETLYTPKEPGTHPAATGRIELPGLPVPSLSSECLEQTLLLSDLLVQNKPNSN